MRHAKKLLSLLLAFLLIFSLAACQQTPAETTTAPTETTAAPTETTATPTETTAPEETTEATEPLTPEEQILKERRQTVIDYMLKDLSVLWRADIESEITYSPAKPNAYETLVPGRIYQGLPYSFGSSSVYRLLDFASSQDEKGIYNISGITMEMLDGATAVARLGNDCSSAVAIAWSQINASITHSATRKICEDNGYLPVGDYQNIPDTNENSGQVIAMNGADVMFAAYAQLKPADALARSGHMVLVTDVDVVYQDDGTIDSKQSTVTIIDQTSTNQKQGASEWNEALGERVYIIGNAEPLVFNFRYLLKEAYLPVTCKELRDPTPLPEPEITDTLTEYNKDNLFSGTINSNWWIDTVTVTITDSEGQPLQEASTTAIRHKHWFFEMERFVTDDPKSIQGSIDLAALTSGNYHCTVVCRLTTGEEFTVRDFDFTV